MWANDFNCLSHASHLSVLPKKPNIVLSTRWLCHITPSESGTSPSRFLLKRFASAPWKPVISADGMRVMAMRRRPPCGL